MNTRTTISIDEIKQTLLPYMDNLKLQIRNENIDYPFLIIKKDRDFFSYCLEDVYKITKNETILTIKAKCYTLTLFIDSNSIHSTSF